MIGNRSLSLNRSSLMIVGLAALLGLTALIAVSLNGQSRPAASPAGAPAAGDLTGLRPVEAYAARWAGLAEEYAPVQAYAARWAGLAEALGAPGSGTGGEQGHIFHSGTHLFVEADTADAVVYPAGAEICLAGSADRQPEPGLTRRPC